MKVSYGDAARQYRRADVDIKGFVEARVRLVFSVWRGALVRWRAIGGGNPRERFDVFNDIWGSLGKFACGERWREGDTSGATVEARGHAAEIEIL